MKINLRDIPEDGRSYKLDRTEKALNPVLDDLIQKAPYNAEFFIRPLSTKDFELKGWIKTETPEVCSRCATEFKHKVDAKFHEFLIPKMDQPRGSRYSHPNHVSELPVDGPEYSEYENDEFDLGEYLHEVIAMAVPFNVACPPENKDCKIWENPKDEQHVSINKDVPLEKPQSPFAALKNLKLN